MSTPINLSDSGETTFDPPLWLSRRAHVLQILFDFNVRSVFDVGCGEGALMSVMMNGVFTKCAGLDVDMDCARQAVTACQPTAYDLRFLRVTKATADIYHGSIKFADSRLFGYDALASVEVIEHLHDDELAEFPRITLGVYSPKILVVSTPNAEFNVFFPNLEYNTERSSFRHWDHKFEWTRQEFQDWANEAATLYDYQVRFSGVGLLRNDSSHGYCTQVATFVRNDVVGLPYSKQSVPCDGSSYQHIQTINLPFYELPELSPSDQIAELRSEILSIYYEYSLRVSDSGWDEERVGNTRQIRAQFICSLDILWAKLRVKQICKSKDSCKQLLRDAGFVISSSMGNGKLLVADEVEERIQEGTPWFDLAFKVNASTLGNSVKLYIEVDFVEVVPMTPEPVSTEEDSD